jgi:hypothetical protein
MHPRTIATLAEIEGVKWFSNVGRRDSDRVAFLATWQEAVASCASEPWEELTQEAANQYTSRLAERDTERFNKWNEIVKEVKKLTVPLVLLKTEEVVQANKLPRVFVDTVQWDILHMCMEAEYADVFPPGFYASQAHWYLRGHFPCGWQGDFPQGRLIVF